MLNDTNAGFRVTVWRPYTPTRALTIKDFDGSKMTLLGPDSALQQEAFAFQSKEDIWGGLIDSELREALSARFMSDFEPVRAPEERSFTQLSAFLNELQRACPESEWSSSGHQLDDDGEESVRLNPLLAFLSHMSWIYETFKDTPGASVSVR